MASKIDLKQVQPRTQRLLKVWIFQKFPRRDHDPGLCTPMLLGLWMWFSPQNLVQVKRVLEGVGSQEVQLQAGGATRLLLKNNLGTRANPAREPAVLTPRKHISKG